MKRFFSQIVALQCGVCLFLFTTCASIICILTIDDVALKYIATIMFNFVFAIGGMPMLIIGLGTITFCEDGIIYKNSLFSRKQKIYYNEATKVQIDYKNYPRGLKSAAPKRIYIIEKDKIRCQIDISLGIIKELLKHIEKSKITISFFENLHGFPKKHRKLLYEYLKTEKQKCTVTESLKKDIEISVVVILNNSKNDIEKCLNRILQQDYKRSRYEILLIMDSYLEGAEEIVSRYLLESDVFYRFFWLKGKNSNIQTLVNNNALSKRIYFVNEKDILTDNQVLRTFIKRV